MTLGVLRCVSCVCVVALRDEAAGSVWKECEIGIAPLVSSLPFPNQVSPANAPVMSSRVRIGDEKQIRYN